MWAKAGELKGEKVLPTIKITGDQLVTVEIDDETEARAIGVRRSDIVGGNKVTGANLGNMVGAECIIETVQHGLRLGVLQPGKDQGRYDIQPFDVHLQSLRDVEIVWAAPIEIIIRSRR